MSVTPRPNPAPNQKRVSAASRAAVRDWPGYFDAVGDAGPRETLLDALGRFESEGVVDPDRPPLAIDLGCGSGRDTIELLNRGWRVLAVDGVAEAIERLLARPELAGFTESPRLATRRMGFEETRLPPARLVSSSYSLPFCPPAHFDRLWSEVVASIEPGGRFAGQFLGDEDDWVGAQDMVHHTVDEVQALLRGFDIERFETDLYGPDPDAIYPKRWHVFHVVARKQA